MNYQNRPAQGRGLRRAFMDGGADIPAVLNAVTEMNRTFAAFREANDKRLSDLEKGRADVLSDEQVDRINASLTEQQAVIDGMNQRIAGLSLSGGGGQPQSRPQNREHTAAFNNYFRRGDASALDALRTQNAATTGSEADGGYMVPVEMDTTIDRVLGTVSAMRTLATVRQVSSNTFRKPITVGGALAGWVGETGNRSNTDGPELSAIDFAVMELYAQPAATQAMLDDASFDIAAWLADEVTLTFAEQEGAAFCNGNGVTRPMGVFAEKAVANSKYSWGSLGYIATGLADGFPAKDPADVLVSLVYAIKSGYRQNASWLMNRATQGIVRKFKDGEGNYIWQPGATAGQPATLLGYPVADDDNVADVGAGALPVAFGDFKRGYLIVDRVGIRVLRDNLTQKPYVLFYTTKRVGGGVQNFEAIKLLKVAAN